LAQDEFLYKLNGVAGCGPDLATRNDCFVCLTSRLKQLRIDKRTAANSQSADLAPINGYQRGNGFIAGIQESLGNRLEGDTCFGELDASVFGVPE